MDYYFIECKESKQLAIKYPKGSSKSKLAQVSIAILYIFWNSI